MQGYAGVIAMYQGRLALVREQYDAWDAEYWNLPSGAVESGESPTAGAIRELREETGLQAIELNLLWTTTVTRAGETLSRSWNYTATVTSPEFAIDDPDGSIFEAAWFAPEEAARLLRQLPYPPISVPSVGYLADGAAPGTAWSFTLTGETWSWDCR